MDEKPDQIIGHIEAQRHELGRNLNELEARVKENADWRKWFDRNPLMVMGAALGGGVLIGSVIGGKTSGITRRSMTPARGRTHSGSSASSGAMIIGAASAGTTSQADNPAHSGESRIRSAMSSVKQSESWHQVTDTVDDVRAALIAFGIAKAREFLTQSLPGFEQHLNEAQQRRKSQHGRQQQNKQDTPQKPNEESLVDGSDQPNDQSGRGRHLYTPSGEQISRSGSYSSDPVGAFNP